jgi:hypothetical protein
VLVGLVACPSEIQRQPNGRSVKVPSRPGRSRAAAGRLRSVDVACADADGCGASVSIDRAHRSERQRLGRLAILIAGIVATIAALLSLLRLRPREVQYSSAIAYFFDETDLPGPCRHGLVRSPPGDHEETRRSSGFQWSGRRDSNSGPSPPGALIAGRRPTRLDKPAWLCGIRRAALSPLDTVRRGSAATRAATERWLRLARGRGARRGRRRG